MDSDWSITSDFEKALGELDEPLLDDFDFFVEAEGVKIYKKYVEESGLYEYKTIGTMDCTAETCFKVYMDLEYRKTWDSYVQELKEEHCNPHNIILWNVKYPFPLSNRDYTFIRDAKELSVKDRRIWVILARSMKHDFFPEKANPVRVTDYKQLMVIEDVGEGKTKAFMHYYDNPRGNIPTWLLNWAAKKGVPSFLSMMKKACASYDDYLAKKAKKK